MANVGVRYTGTDGRTTAFSASSSDMAISRLNGIRGYVRNAGDDVADAVSKGWRERHLRRAEGFAAEHGFVGQTSGKHYASNNGIVSSEKRVTGVSVVNGKIVQTVREDYIASDGTQVGMSARRDEVVGTIPKEQKVVQANIDGSVSVVVQTVYDQNTHKLYNVMGEIYVDNGKLCIRKGGEQSVTTAVEESIA